MPIYVKKEGNAQASADQGFKFSIASQRSCHVHTTPRCETSPPASIPPFSLSQNLSSKNELRQLITCGQNLMTSTLIISG